MVRIEGECWCGGRIAWEGESLGFAGCSYDAGDVPLDVAVDLDGKESCCRECGQSFKLVLPAPDWVVMQIKRCR